MQNYLVNVDSDAIEVAKKVLRTANISQNDIDSFLLGAQDFIEKFASVDNKFQEISIEALIEKLVASPQATVYFRHSGRLLQEAEPTNTNSQLFTNMTPSVLSGLFVALFLIIMLIIGINCLYNIKTNDKFGRQNLWVGKES